MRMALNSAGRSFGRYELVAYLGSGGMSDVFEALHRGLRRRVALKLLRPSLLEDSEAVARFLREGECAARVSHANVVDVLDVGTEEGIPYLVMELLQGETLERKLRREGPFSLQAVVDLMLPILDGVAATHAAGVLHRDIKPANILLARMADGSVVPKLLDFGIATVEERRSITGSLGPIGTPHYMSPEQARGERALDERSDQFSLASVIFELLTGREPFAGGDVNVVLQRVARGKFPRARSLRPSVPSAFDDVLLRAAARDPEQRYPSVSAFAEALLPFASERTRRLWISRGKRGGFTSAQLLSGAYRPDNDVTQVTRVTPLIAALRAPVTQTSSAGTYSASFLALASFVLVLGLGVGLLRSRTGAEAESITLSSASVPAREAPLPLPALQRVSVTPPEAQVWLDGKSLGSGDFSLPTLADDRVHELRLAAPGHVPRIVLFRKQVDPRHIVLDPLAP